MVFFLLGHLLEYLRRLRIASGKIFGKADVDAAVFFFAGDRHGQHFAFGQVSEIPHEMSQII